jgi:hypothetical protein
METVKRLKNTRAGRVKERQTLLHTSIVESPAQLLELH